MLKVVQAALLWLFSEGCQMSTSVQVVFKWIQVPSKSRQLAVFSAQLADEFGHRFSYFVWYAEVTITLMDALRKF